MRRNSRIFCGQPDGKFLSHLEGMILAAVLYHQHLCAVVLLLEEIKDQFERPGQAFCFVVGRDNQ